MTGISLKKKRAARPEDGRPFDPSVLTRDLYLSKPSDSRAAKHCPRGCINKKYDLSYGSAVLCDWSRNGQKRGFRGTDFCLPEQNGPLAMSANVKGFGHGAMSDLSPLCASKRMSANGRVYEPSPTRTASWQLSMRGFEGLNSSCGRFAPNQSHCAPAATKQPVGQNFAFAVGQIIARTPAILSPRKGRWPSSPNVGMGLRWTRQCRA